MIKDGEIAILETMPEPNKTWAMEVLETINTSNNLPTGPETKVTPIVTVGTKVETANSTITGGKCTYTNPVIPVGFKAVNTNEALWEDKNNDGIVDGWNNGLVLQDENENEFVWVPIEEKNVDYKKWCTEGISYTDTTDDEEALPMKDESTRITETEQITKYGGFYIGRYEAGVPANQTKIDGTDEETSNTTGIPTVKQGQKVWTNIDYINANENALSFYNTDNVKSGLVTGTQWDAVMKWLEKSGISVTDSRTWGNYTNSESPADLKGYGEKQSSGYSEYWKAKNIYDLAGNVSEWTGEFRSSDCVCRGGEYKLDGWFNPATLRGAIGTEEPCFSSSFRIALYVT